MMLREPPRIAAWLLQQFVTTRRRDSLLGDLFEEFQTGRSCGWYWRETLTALLVHARSEARELLAKRAAQALLVATVQSAPWVYIFVLLEQYGRRCPSLPLLLSRSTVLVTCAGIAGVAIAAALRLGSLRHPVQALRRRVLLRLSVVAFAALGFGAGAATWAGTASCVRGGQPYLTGSAQRVLLRPDVPRASREPGRCAIGSSQCRSR